MIGKLPERMMNVNEVAQLLGVSRRSILRLIAAGEIPCYKILGGVNKNHWRFKQKEVAQWIESKKII